MKSCLRGDLYHRDEPWTVDTASKFEKEFCTIMRAYLQSANALEVEILDRRLDKNTDINKWLLNWELTRSECAKAGIHGATEAAAIDQFLDAILDMLPAFYNLWVLRMEMRLETTIADLIVQYRSN